MTPERMQIRLAEWAGWTRCQCPDTECDWKTPPGGGMVMRAFPDYPADLNAVRELAMGLRSKDRLAYMGYIGWLQKIVAIGNTNEWGEYSEDASAPQRCEALLKTLNLWEDA